MTRTMPRTEEYRSPVVLSDLHDLRYAEIAAVLQLPEGTVKSRIFRGRRMLQKTLVRYAIEMGYVDPSCRGALAEHGEGAAV